MKKYQGIKQTSILAMLIIVALVIASPVMASGNTTPVFYELHAERECSPDTNQFLYLPGVARMKVPVGALDEVTDVGMTFSFWWNMDDPDLMMEFSPHGTYFNTPVKIRLSLLMMQFYYGDEIGVFYFDEDLGSWYLVDTIIVDFWNANYTVELDHFSVYAFSKIKNGD